MGPVAYEKLQFHRHTGYPLNLDNPTTWNEKLTARKLNPAFIEALFLQDKYASREFVKERVGEKYLVNLYDITDSPEKIDSSRYPSRFVLKATNSCGASSIFIHDDPDPCPVELAKEKARAIYQKHDTMFNRFYYYSNEWWYGEIPTRLMVEELLSDGCGVVPLDYKFFVFHGRVHFIQIDFGRFTNHTRALYDRDWKKLDVRLGYPPGPGKERPVNLDEMIKVAETIAAEYHFLRVDLYNINDEEIRFGELTIAPSLGHSKIEPVSFDHYMGSLWNYDSKEPQ